MSRYHPEWDLTPILDAAEYWKKEALLGQRAVLGSGAVWSTSNLEELKKYFVDNLDYGEGNFMSKLESQLAPSAPGTKQLAAEMMWFMLLCPSNIGQENKRETVLTIWDWSGVPRPDSFPLLTDDVLRGVGSAGTAFNTHRWRELVFCIRFLLAFRALDDQQARGVLEDGWKFAEWIESVEDADKRQLRHMILYLLFPDSFDRIFGASDRRKLLLSFTDMSRPQVRKLSALDMSREIQGVREEQEQKYGTKELDFYRSPLKEVWQKERDKPEKPDAKTSAFKERTIDVRRYHVLQALGQIDKDGVPVDAESSTYDLIHGSTRYPPKYVLSLAVKFATGEDFPRSFFSGGIESQAFKLLQQLGFDIERKDFVSELVKDFLKQADEGVSLVVSDYPKEYRGLRVKVSFGQGVQAHIPWISFTGYEQTTSNGIYPVLLYYKSLGVLIVTRGISETNAPISQWKGADQFQTIETFLKDRYGEEPQRYGRSYVREAFDLNEQVDISGIQNALDDVIGDYHRQFSKVSEPPGPKPTDNPYGPAEALADLFIAEEKFRELLSLLRLKKNLILQGPPGVGKSFACKRLAYAHIGEKDPNKLGMVQFHQSYSYEDFVQGYRPSGTGFRLKNGIFYEFCNRARNDPAGTYVFVIDELNRGNLSKVFGELMLLIEPDKRGPDWAIPLTYSEDSDDSFYIPENLYLIGLMNTADRSLAMVDYALRRRFAFADLEPGFELDEFQDFLTEKGADAEFIEELVTRLGALNSKIAEDTTNLGPGFCIGHSFFCAVPEGAKPDWEWYSTIIKTEIAPLLREYYFDDTKQSKNLIDSLLRES